MSPAVRPDDRRAWVAAVALAGLLLAVDGAMVWAFRVRPWTLVVPGVVLAVALRGRSATLASWRDGLGILCLVTIPLVGLLPIDFPRPARFALNSLGTAGIVLLVLGLILDEGLGAGMRQRSAPLAREAFRQAKTRIGQLGTLIAVAIWIGFLWGRVELPGLLLVVPCLAIVTGLCPERWTKARDGLRAVGCLSVVVAIGGAVLRAWSWEIVALALVPIYLPDEVRKSLAPVAPKDTLKRSSPESPKRVETGTSASLAASSGGEEVLSA